MTLGEALIPYAISSGTIVVLSMVALWLEYGRPRKPSMLISVAVYGSITLNVVAGFVFGYLVTPNDRFTGIAMMAAVVLMPAMAASVMGLILRWRRDKDL